LCHVSEVVVAVLVAVVVIRLLVVEAIGVVDRYVVHFVRVLFSPEYFRIK
jgi:hypothetical protein